MLQCPSCDTTLDQDFGMVTCKNCKSVLMIDFSGQVQVGNEVSQDFSDPVEEETLPPIVEDEVTNDFLEATDPIEGFNDNLESTENSQIYTESFGEEFDETTHHGVEASSVEIQNPVEFEETTNSGVSFGELEGGEEIVESEDVIPENDIFSGDSNPMDSNDGESIHAVTDIDPEDQGVTATQDEEAETFSMPTAPDHEPVDVTEFANSEDSNLDEGELVYDLTISRLDSKDLRENLKYVLMDEKLKLNHHEYIKKIRNGQVTIPNLNPLKTKRIVEQLQFFDIGIRWNQKRIVMEEINNESEEEVQGAADDVNL